MDNHVIDALYRVFAIAIYDDFWDEDSELVSAYHDEVGEQLDCEGVSSWMAKNGTMRITVGGLELRVTITEE